MAKVKQTEIENTEHKYISVKEASLLLKVSTDTIRRRLPKHNKNKPLNFQNQIKQETRNSAIYVSKVFLDKHFHYKLVEAEEHTQDQATHTQSKTTHTQGTGKDYDSTLKALTEQLRIKDKQLATKDKQIEKLQNNTQYISLLLARTQEKFLLLPPAVPEKKGILDFLNKKIF